MRARKKMQNDKEISDENTRILNKNKEKAYRKKILLLHALSQMSVAMPSLAFQRRPAIMPSLALPALGTSRTVRRIQRRRRFSCSNFPGSSYNSSIIFYGNKEQKVLRHQLLLLQKSRFLRPRRAAPPFPAADPALPSPNLHAAH